MVTEPAARALEAYRGRKVILGMRPEHLVLGDGAEGRSFDCVVEVVEQLGSEILVEARLGATRITIARVPAETAVAAGDRVRVSVPPGRLHFSSIPTRKRQSWPETMTRPLSAYRVLELGTLRPAPTSLGCLRLRRRRQSRSNRPAAIPTRAFPPLIDAKTSGWFAYLNYGKKSVTSDAADLDALLGSAHVLIDSTGLDHSPIRNS